ATTSTTSSTGRWRSTCESSSRRSAPWCTAVASRRCRRVPNARFVAPREEERMSETTLSERIRQATPTITVVGQGYVGLPLAVEFARAGFAVYGFDQDPGRVVALASGASHSPDVTAAELVLVLERGRYCPTTDPANIERSDVIVICVPT